MIFTESSFLERCMVSLFGKWLVNQHGCRFGKVWRGRLYVNR